MLKWLVSRPSSPPTHELVTEDPLATLTHDANSNGKVSQVYAVSRVNPLFQDEEGESAAGGSGADEAARGGADRASLRSSGYGSKETDSDAEESAEGRTGTRKEVCVGDVDAKTDPEDRGEGETSLDQNSGEGCSVEIGGVVGRKANQDAKTDSGVKRHLSETSPDLTSEECSLEIGRAVEERICIGEEDRDAKPDARVSRGVGETPLGDQNSEEGSLEIGRVVGEGICIGKEDRDTKTCSGDRIAGDTSLGDLNSGDGCCLDIENPTADVRKEYQTGDLTRNLTGDTERVVLETERHAELTEKLQGGRTENAVPIDQVGGKRGAVGGWNGVVNHVVSSGRGSSELDNVVISWQSDFVHGISLVRKCRSLEDVSDLPNDADREVRTLPRSAFQSRAILTQNPDYVASVLTRKQRWMQLNPNQTEEQSQTELNQIELGHTLAHNPEFVASIQTEKQSWINSKPLQAKDQTQTERKHINSFLHRRQEVRLEQGLHESGQSQKRELRLEQGLHESKPTQKREPRLEQGLQTSVPTYKHHNPVRPNAGNPTFRNPEPVPRFRFSQGMEDEVRLDQSLDSLLTPETLHLMTPRGEMDVVDGRTQPQVNLVRKPVRAQSYKPPTSFRGLSSSLSHYPLRLPPLRPRSRSADGESSVCTGISSVGGVASIVALWAASGLKTNGRKLLVLDRDDETVSVDSVFGSSLKSRHSDNRSINASLDNDVFASISSKGNGRRWSLFDKQTPGMKGNSRPKSDCEVSIEIHDGEMITNADQITSNQGSIRPSISDSIQSKSLGILTDLDKGNSKPKSDCEVSIEIHDGEMHPSANQTTSNQDNVKSSISDPIQNRSNMDNMSFRIPDHSPAKMSEGMQLEYDNGRNSTTKPISVEMSPENAFENANTQSHFSASEDGTLRNGNVLTTSNLSLAHVNHPSLTTPTSASITQASESESHNQIDQVNEILDRETDIRITNQTSAPSIIITDPIQNHSYVRKLSIPTPSTTTTRQAYNNLGFEGENGTDGDIFTITTTTEMIPSVPTKTTTTPITTTMIQGHDNFGFEGDLENDISALPMNGSESNGIMQSDVIANSEDELEKEQRARELEEFQRRIAEKLRSAPKHRAYWLDGAILKGVGPAGRRVTFTDTRTLTRSNLSSPTSLTRFTRPPSPRPTMRLSPAPASYYKPPWTTPGIHHVLGETRSVIPGQWGYGSVQGTRPHPNPGCVSEQCHDFTLDFQRSEKQRKMNKRLRRRRRACLVVVVIFGIAGLAVLILAFSLYATRGGRGAEVDGGRV